MRPLALPFDRSAVRALARQAGLGFWFCLAVLGPDYIGPDGQPAGYAAAAAAGFGVFVVGCVTNICLETHGKTLF